MDSYVNLSSRIAGIFSKGDNSVNFMSFSLFLDWVTHMDSYVNLSSRIAGIFSKGDNSVNFMSFFLFLDWVTVCLVFSIIALILSLVSAVCGVLGLLVADTEQKKRRFYLSAGGFMSFVGTFKITLNFKKIRI